jgi:phosphoribosylamine--glycine ligase
VRVLVIGSGAREHALAWKLRQSPRVSAVFCAPGNAGTATVAENVDIAPERIDTLRDFARAKEIGITVVGPEQPLVLGIADGFERDGLRVFGPTRAGAELEGSKAFTKEVLRRAGAPTARYHVCDDAAAAYRAIDALGTPVVVKADGLAAGKGVVVCASAGEARAAVDQLMTRRIFGDAGRRLVVEECLRGEELSFMALTDGVSVVPLASSQDHKRLRDGDLGPNTGGMGAYSPAPLLTPALEARVMETIMRPVIAELRRSGIVYRGVLYAGLMVDDGAPSVLEFNVRFGDPECQVLMLRLRSDLVELIEAVLGGGLAGCVPEWDPRPSAGVVLAAPGYPGPPETGTPIGGLDAAAEAECVVFHAATARHDGRVVSSGGRVLTVAALGDDLATAVARAYAGVARIDFAGAQYRRDIGHRALGAAAREEST